MRNHRSVLIAMSWVLLFLTFKANAQKPELVIQTGHSAVVNSVAFSPDGKILASGSWDSSIKLWDVTSGKQLRSLTGHTSEVKSVVFSPDGKLLASGSADQTIKLWDVATGKLLRSLPKLTEGISSIAFSPDGKILASISNKAAISLWNIATGKLRRSLTKPADTYQTFNAITFSPDGRTLASGGNQITIWNAEDGNKIRSFDSGYVSSIAFNPAGKTLAAGGEYITLWNLESGKGRVVERTHDPFFTLFTPVTFSPDGKILAGGVSGNIKIWDLESGKELHVINGHSKGICSLQFSPDGKILASASEDFTIKLWDAITGKEHITLKSHSSSFASITFSPDGKTLASGGTDNTIKLWTVENGKQFRSLTGHSYGIYSVQFSPDGKMLASGSGDLTIKLWGRESSKELRSLKGHSQIVRSVAFSPDGKTLASGSYDSNIGIWDVGSGKQLHALKGHSRGVFSVHFSPDGKTLASGGADKTVKLWDVATGKQLSSLSTHTDEISSIAFSPDGKMLVNTYWHKPTLDLWDLATGKILLTLIPIDQTDWVAIDADGRFDASPNAQRLMYWRVGGGLYDVIEFEQLKERYYEPGLIQKIFGFNKEPLRKVEAFNAVKLPPKVAWTTPATDSTKMTITLANRGGGVGKVQVLVNGKEAIADARPAELSPDIEQPTTLTVDLKDSAFIKGKVNNIEVVAWNYDQATKKGYVSSPRGVRKVWQPQGKSETATPELYAIVGGVSDYAGDLLDLRYAAKDAEEFAHALDLGATNLLGKEHVHIKLLTTGSKDPQAIAPTKANFRKIFEEFRQAKPIDILVLYLAGHGVTLQQGSDLYLYLTQEARTTDASVLSDDLLRESMSISSEELAKWLTQIKALKQVMVLDTCAAAAAAASLIARRDLPSDQIRALDRLKDRTGFFVLMGSAADAVSYEASRYGQGLLTYTLLEAMKGAKLREGFYADVNDLFGYAADRVPQMARNIGGIQRPVIISPLSGSSFDIGRYTEKERGEIRLSQVKPLILRPRLQNKELDYDNLKLEVQLRQALRDASFVSVRRERESALVYVDADEMTDAVTPSGSYVIEGDKVKVTVKLIRNDKPEATVTIEGNKNDKEGLIKQIIQSITQKSMTEPETRKIK